MPRSYQVGIQSEFGDPPRDSGFVETALSTSRGAFPDGRQHSNHCGSLLRIYEMPNEGASLENRPVSAKLVLCQQRGVHYRWIQEQCSTPSPRVVAGL